MPFDLCPRLPSLNLGEKLRRVSAVSTSTSGTNSSNFRFRNRRAAFSVVHFKKEKVIRQLETAICNSDVTMIDEVVAMITISELEEDTISFVKNACELGI